MWKKLSLRTRLTILYAGLLTLLLTILGITFFVDTRNLLIENTACRIRAMAKPIIEQWLYGKSFPGKKKETKKTPDENYLKKIAKSLARDLTSRNTVAVVLDGTGKILANGKILDEEPMPPSPDSRYCKRALSGENEVSYILSASGEDFLVLLIPLRSAPGSKKIIGVVQLASRLVDVEKTLYRHAIALATGTLITLLLGTGLGLILISSALSELRHMIATCQNITEGRLDQRVHLPDRSDEVGQLAQAFNKMVERLEAAFSAQRRFVASAAHELRTPLTALRGSIEVLMRGAQDDPATVASLCQAMYREVIRLSGLCEQLLDLARLEISGNVQKESVVLGEFFREFLEQARVLDPTRHVVLKEGPFVSIHVDPNLLKQIMFNLFQNALEHTGTEGCITMGWKLGSEGVEIWVEDDGHGILPEDLPHIFEPFYQGKRACNKEGHQKGSGLGLTLVRAMVEAHSGKISVQTEVGKGTRFTIELPFE